MAYFRKISLIVVLALVIKSVSAQDFNDYRDAEAVMLQVNGNNNSEKKLESVIVALLNSSNQLTVKLNIPYASINGNEADELMVPFPDYRFNLKVKIDIWKIQESLTSGKTFDTDGYLTLNHITKLVLVEYTPLPPLSDLNGGFNLNLIIGFNPADFNLGVPDADTRVFIKIGDAPVNRL
jgi:hypothetical protein